MGAAGDAEVNFRLPPAPAASRVPCSPSFSGCYGRCGENKERGGGGGGGGVALNSTPETIWKLPYETTIHTSKDAHNRPYAWCVEPRNRKWNGVKRRVILT